MERVVYHIIDNKPTLLKSPTDAYVKNGLAAVTKRLLTDISPMPRMGTEQFVSRYAGRRRRVYERAAKSLEAKPVCQKDSMVVSNCKREKMAWKAGLCPRLISPRNPRYQLALGRYIAVIERELYTRLSKRVCRSTVPVVQKGFNAVAVARNIRCAMALYDHPVVVGIDASRFDQHIREALLRWEHSVYRAFFPRDLKLAELLAWQINAKAGFYTTDGAIRYTAYGRCSGDMNTGLGNCLIMVCLLTAYCEEAGLRCPQDASLINNGDDCLIITEAANLRKLDSLPDWFLKMGMIMKVEPAVTQIEKIEFCQCHPVYDGTEYRMVRNLWPSLAKDSTITHHLGPQYPLRDHLASVGTAGLALTSGLPVLQEYYSAFLRAGGKQVPDYLDGTGMWHLARGMTPNPSPITTDARVSFWRAFGVVPDRQRDIENYFRNTNNIFAEERGVVDPVIRQC